MNGFDFAVLAILLISLLIGLWRGLLYEVLSLLGWPMAFVLSKLLSDSIATLLPIAHEAMRVTAAYALVFVAVLIAWGIVVKLVSRMLKAVGSVSTDRALGGLFGLLRGGMVVLALAWVVGLTRVPEQLFWRDAASTWTLENIALLTKTWLPDDIAKHVHFRDRS